MDGFSTKLRMSAETIKPMSRRAIAAALKKRLREDAVLAPLRPTLDGATFDAFLRTGSI